MLEQFVTLLNLRIILNELHVFDLIINKHANCLTKVLTVNGPDIDLDYLYLPLFLFNSNLEPSNLEKSLQICPILIIGKYILLCLNVFVCNIRSSQEIIEKYQL